jgi:subtilisin family serine protease
MLSWQSNPNDDAEFVINHITQFRLSREPHHYPDKLEHIWWSVLIELNGVSIDQFEQSVSAFADELIIPVAYDALDRQKVLPSQPVALYVRKPLIDWINRRGNSRNVSSVWLGAVTPDRFLKRGAFAMPMPDILVEDDTVVQALIDDGIAIGHDLFRKSATSSRIEHARIFDAPPDNASTTSVGRGLDKADIDRLLCECSSGGFLDEDLFYQRTRQVNTATDVFSTVALRRSHGTHVMGLSAGQTMAYACENRPIICATLPSRVVRDTTGVDMLPLLYLAFHILVKQARRFRTASGGIVPVVFNFSYGNNGGPHDGTGLLATMFEHYFGENADQGELEPQKAWLTLPAGNSNLERLHALDETSSADGNVQLDVSLLPDDGTPTHLQFWLPASCEDDQPNFASLKVTAPFGGEMGVIQTQPGQHSALCNSNNKQVAWLAYQFVGGATQRGLVTLSINPTGNLKETADLAPAGRWRVEIERNEQAPQEPIHVWILRDETLPGMQPGGRQAYFSNPDYKRFDRYGAPLAVDPPDNQSPIRRSGTLSGFACGPSPIVVAAYTEQSAHMSPYSTSGPLNASENSPRLERQGPDLTAKGDDSPVLRGVISAGSRSGSWVRLSGTSVAAPQIARLASKHIKDRTNNGRDWAKSAANCYPFHLKGDPPRERAGAGGVEVADLKC